MVDSRPWQDWHGNPGCSASFLPPCSCCRFLLSVRCPSGARFLPGWPLCPCFAACCRNENLRHPKALLRATLAAYLMGFLWFCGNCYWIYQTMLYFGGLPPLISAGILVGYSMVLGLYFAALGFLLTATARAFRRHRHYALIAAPFFWVALELLSARLTKVPWDLLGYSQIDNFLLTSLAPYTGVYGITFVLVAGNALIAWGFLASTAETPDSSTDKRFSRRAGVAERRSFCSQRGSNFGHCRFVATKS